MEIGQYWFVTFTSETTDVISQIRITDITEKTFEFMFVSTCERMRFPQDTNEVNFIENNSSSIIKGSSW